MVLSRSVRTHAGFIKRENSQEIVLQGWKEITSILNSKNMRKELLDASRELAENFCKEMDLDLATIRLFEASLFMSMIPLHKDGGI